MQIILNAFWLQKSGNLPSEYEDAFSYSTITQDKDAEFLCAVADGATETSFSGLWARILTDAYVKKYLTNINQDMIKDLSQQWRFEIQESTKEKPLPWYAEEKLNKGAYSSLMGLTLNPDGSWSGICVGDSCLFQIRGASNLSFPYENPQQFNNTPSLISTTLMNNTMINPLNLQGNWQSGDYFFLMTDALGHYFISDRHLKRRFRAKIFDQSYFEELIYTAQKNKLCKNDDITLLIINVK